MDGEGWDVLFEDDDTLAAELFAEGVLFGEVDWESALHGDLVRSCLVRSAIESLVAGVWGRQPRLIFDSDSTLTHVKH